MVLPKLEGWLLLQQLHSVQVQHENAKKGCLRISTKKARNDLDARGAVERPPH